MTERQTPKPAKKPRLGYTERKQHQLDLKIAAVSDTNRPLAHRLDATCRRRACKPATILRYVTMIYYADQMFPGRPLLALSPDDWGSLLDSRRRIGTPTSGYGDTIATRAVLRTLLKTKQLPAALDEATAMRDPGPPEGNRIIETAEFDRLLTATSAFRSRFPGRAVLEQMQALLWLFWDTGFRAQELLTARIGDLRLQPDGGALLTIRYQDGIKNKGSARTVYLLESVPILRAWLDCHPAQTDPHAPLWYGLRGACAAQQLTYGNFAKVFDRLVNDAGLGACSSLDGAITLHDFRHTCATRKARLGWNEAKLRAWFGWSRSSKMPGRYVKIATQDLRDQVRRDAGVDDHGYAQALDVGDDQAALAAILQRIMAGQQRTTARTIRPGTPSMNEVPR